MKKITRIGCCLTLACAGSVSAAEQPRYGAADFLPTPDQPIGFRADGNGWYPGATPPVEWWEGPPALAEVPVTQSNDGFDPAKAKPAQVWVTGAGPSKNILWKTPLPGWGDVQPIVVGRRVLTAVDPDIVLCLDADTGKMLWEDRLRLMNLPVLDEQRQIGAVPASADALQTTWEIVRAFFFLRVQAVHGCGAVKNGSQFPDEHWARQRPVIERCVATIERWRTRLPADSPPELVQGLDATMAQWRGLLGAADEKVRHDAWWAHPNGIGRRDPFAEAFRRLAGRVTTDIVWQGHVGGAFSTPVSDGSIAVFCFAYGQVAAYDVASGKRLWAFRDALVPSSQHINHGPSPLMFRDLVLVRSGDGQAIMGLDKATGQLRWETQIQMHKRGSGANHGNYLTPLLMEIPDGQGGRRSVLVTQNSPVLDPATGKQLGHLAIPERSDRGSMVGREGVVFTGWGYDAPASPVFGFRLALDGERLATERLPNLKAGRTGDTALTYRPGVLIGLPGWLADPVTGIALFHSREGQYPSGGEGNPGTLCGELMISCQGPNSFNRNRGDNSIISPFWVQDLHDPLAPRLWSKRNLLGNPERPADLIFDTWMTGFDKQVNLGCYKGIAPWLGCRVGGVVAKGNRLFIQTNLGLYCIGPEALGSPQDDPAVVQAIANSTGPALAPYLAAERPRYRLVALQRLAELRIPLSVELRATVEKLLVADPFEEVRAAALQLLDQADPAGRPGSVWLLAEVAGGLQDYVWHRLETQSRLCNAVLTVRALGGRSGAWLEAGFAAQPEPATLAALLHLAYMLDVALPVVTDRALALAADPKADRRFVERSTWYLAHTAWRDPRALPALRTSPHCGLHGLEALCLRTPVAELGAMLAQFLRTQRIENHWWPVVVRGCQRLDVERATALLEKLAADKPEWAKKCQEILAGLGAPAVNPRVQQEKNKL
jgi:outer membrane protein assembly factor BamB